MESLENKIIQEKVDSLNTLPGGYEVNLSGKWEIVLAAMGNKKPKRALWLWNSAAAILILSGLFWLNLKPEQSTIVIQQIPVGKIKPGVVKMEQLPAIAVVEKIKNSRSGQKAVGKKQSIAFVSANEMPSAVTFTDSVVSVADTQEKLPVAAARKIKPTVVVVDFTDSIKPQAWVALANSTRPKFRFTIGSVAKGSTNKTSSESPLKLLTKF